MFFLMPPMLYIVIPPTTLNSMGFVWGLVQYKLTQSSLQRQAKCRFIINYSSISNAKVPWINKIIQDQRIPWSFASKSLSTLLP